MNEIHVDIYSELIDRLIRQNVTEFCPHCKYGLGYALCKNTTGAILNAIGTKAVMTKCSAMERHMTFRKFAKRCKESVPFYNRTWDKLLEFATPELLLNRYMKKYVDYMNRYYLRAACDTNVDFDMQ